MVVMCQDVGTRPTATHPERNFAFGYILPISRVRIGRPVGAGQLLALPQRVLKTLSTYHNLKSKIEQWH